MDNINHFTLIQKGRDYVCASDPESENENDIKKKYQELCHQLVKINHENLKILKDKAMIKAQINILEMEQHSSKDKDEAGQENLEKVDVILSQELSEEKKSRNRVVKDQIENNEEIIHRGTSQKHKLEKKLRENHQKIRILSHGTKNLDKILLIGQSPMINWDLRNFVLNNNRIGQSPFRSHL